MYNPITEEKIKGIPQIGDINIEELPGELTRIYAEIVSLRRLAADGTINFTEAAFANRLETLRTLANNLETILIAVPDSDHRESIAFVGATANNLISKIAISSTSIESHSLAFDAVSPAISATLLFLIGNSQSDAMEAANRIRWENNDNNIRSILTKSIHLLAKGKLEEIFISHLPEVNRNQDLQDVAVDFLWREIALGLQFMARQLSGMADPNERVGFFDRVVDLSVSREVVMGQRIAFSGPYQLARLLKLLETEIYQRAVVNIPAPPRLDAILWWDFLKRLAAGRPYLWENHQQVIGDGFLEIGVSAILTLPTGAGKSTLSELKIATSVISGKKVLYLVPTHALEFQVKRNLNALFDITVQDTLIRDGEYTELAGDDSASIMVMTPERCLTILNLSPETFTNIGLVVFDEFHLIHGIPNNRRAIDAMYCLLNLFETVPQGDFLLISAMVENGEEIAQWIASILGRECRLFNSIWKPTRQLQGCVVYQKTDINSMNELVRKVKAESTTVHPGRGLQNQLHLQPYCFFSVKSLWESKRMKDYYTAPITHRHVSLAAKKNSWNRQWSLTPNRNMVAGQLALHFAEMGLKTLVFVKDPKAALSTSKVIENGLSRKANDYEGFNLKHANEINELSNELGGLKYSYFDGSFNVGVHHSGLLPIERDLIEQYFKEDNGAVCMVATATLAQGVNLPAEIVIIAGDDRYNPQTDEIESIPPHELLNAAGRAGRAGHSSQGAVIVVPGEIVTIEGNNMSTRWWELKDSVFSKSDQCLKIEDPLEFFLDSITDDGTLTSEQIDILYRFPTENSLLTNTETLLRKSFYRFKSVRDNRENTFEGQVARLVRRKDELNEMSSDIPWAKDISSKTGVAPDLIHEIANSIEISGFNEIMNLSVEELVTWFFSWVFQREENFIGVFPKGRSRIIIRNLIGLSVTESISDNADVAFTRLTTLLIQYLKGATYLDIENKINQFQNRTKIDSYLSKSRDFILRIVPDISFALGILSLVVVQMAKEREINKHDVPWTIRALASCIKEGMDSVEKLFFKVNNNIQLRVETHIRYMLS